MNRYSYDAFPRGLRQLHTRRLVLRPLRRDRDAPGAAALNRAVGWMPKECSFYTDPVKYEAVGTRIHGVTRFYGYRRADQRKPQAVPVIVIGVMLDRDRRLRVSYETHPDQRRKGYATEAQQAMIRQLDRLYPRHAHAEETDLDGRVSQRILRRSGYAFAGLHRSRHPHAGPAKIACFTRASAAALARRRKRGAKKKGMPKHTL